MKKLQLLSFLMFFIILIPINLSAQESDSTRTREIYLNGNLLTFNNFGLQYKSKLKNGNYFRLGVTNINPDLENKKYGTSTPYETTTTKFSGKIEIGLEKRKSLSDKLFFFYGINFITSASFQRVKTENPSLSETLRKLDNISINPGLGFNSGFILRISGNFLIAAEIIPQLVFRYSTAEKISGSSKVKDKTTGGGLVLNNESARISFIYRWNKK